MKTLILILIATLGVFAQSRPDQINIIQTDARAWNEAFASSTYSPAFPVQAAVNGDTSGASWGGGFLFNGGWNSGNEEQSGTSTYTVPFSRNYLLTEIVVVGLKNDFNASREPAEGETTLYANVHFTVQSTPNGTDWLTVLGGEITGNHLVIRRIVPSEPTFSQGVRIVFDNAGGYSRLVELQAFAKNR